MCISLGLDGSLWSVLLNMSAINGIGGRALPRVEITLTHRDLLIVFRFHDVQTMVVIDRNYSRNTIPVFHVYNDHMGQIRTEWSTAEIQSLDVRD